MRFYGLFVMSNVDNYVDKWKNDLWSAVSEDEVLKYILNSACFSCGSGLCSVANKK